MAPDRRMVEAAQWAADQFSAGQPGNRAVRNAFLAWWAAEDGWDWPTNSRNNPGNNRPSGDDTGSVGISGPPTAGFYIYATPGDGVAMMVQRIKRSSHYPGIRGAIAQVARGTGGASVVCKAVGRSPWGTNTVTMIAALAVANRVGASPHGTGWATVHTLGPSAGLPKGIPASAQAPSITASVPAFLAATGRAASAIIAPADIAAYAQWYHDNVATFSDVAETQQLIGYWVGKTWAAIANSTIPWPNADPIANIGAAIAGIPAALGDVAVHVGWLLAILALMLIGLYLLVTSE